MLQVAISGGEVRVVDVPAPVVKPGAVLVRTSHSLISSGTEGAGVTGKAESLAMKALRNPDLVKKVIDRAKNYGVKDTFDLVKSRVATETPIGYSTAGVVVEAGEGVSGFKVGDRVACAGAGFANHAQYNVVPQNLVTKIPDNVSFEEAAFVTLGAIALQGVRRANPTLGERVVVLGLGLLGQLTVQLLRASGAYTIGVDVLRERVDRATALGMDAGFAINERPLKDGVYERTGGVGADAVIVCAAGGDPALLNQAFDLCRRKGRVVLVGDVPMRIQRDKIYKKELDFLISTSYGPGRYDANYEERGQDYPLAYVRWTEGRNMEEILRLVSTGQLKVSPLIDKTLPLEQALDGYLLLKSEARPIGVLLDHGSGNGVPQRRMVNPAAPAVARTRSASEPFRIGVVGFGGYFSGMLLPIITAHKGFTLQSVCSRNGLTVRGAIQRHGFTTGFTDWRELVASDDVDVVYVATRHDQHFEVAAEATRRRKHVFVEKPMTMRSADARELEALVSEHGTKLTVGFNRRFSPHAALMKKQLDQIAAPKTMVYRVNAGALPPEHWSMDPVEGGGRLLGEGVHFFDFLHFIAGSKPVSVCAASPRIANAHGNSATVLLSFEDGSVGTVVYTAEGGPGLPKERVEVHAGGVSFVLDDYKELTAFGSASGLKTKTVDKGQRAHLENFHAALRGQAPLGVTANDGYWATWCAEEANAKVTAN
ncbi:MAG: bi-domain-containing oxidoreductase [Gemmatimonadota bacterium]